MFATAESTARFCAAAVEKGFIHTDHVHVLGRTGLSVSSLGFGCYRVGRNQMHANALIAALQHGVNLIDTSATYGDGDSELQVGAVIRRVVSEELIRRDQLVIVTKAGYLQGRNLQLGRLREDEGRGFPDMVKISPDLWHCIHPEFLEDQIHRSMAKMGLERLDIFLLHNPEYFMHHMLQTNKEVNVQELQQEWYRRIQRAFTFLEQEVQRGRLSFYGISSNVLGGAKGRGDHLSLERLIQIAERVGGVNHHFGVIQFPMNLLETEPYAPWQEHEESLLTQAKRAGIGTLVNRPLNAVVKGGLWRLAESAVSADTPAVDEYLAVVKDLEHQFIHKMGTQFSNPVIKNKNFFPWSHELHHLNLEQTMTDDFDYIEHDIIRPQLKEAFQVIDAYVTEEERVDWAIWRSQYYPAMVQLMGVLRAQIVLSQNNRALLVKNQVGAIVGESMSNASLQQVATKALLACEGVNCVLVGMRRPEYVESLLPVMQQARQTSFQLFFEQRAGR